MATTAGSIIVDLLARTGSFETSMERAQKKVRDADSSLKGLDASAKRSSAAMESLGAMAVRVGAVLGAAFSVRAITQYADAWSDMRSTVGAAVKDMQAAPELMRRMVDIANASYSPLQQTVELYTRNVTVLRELGRSSADAADFTESLNNMLVITATRGQRAASVQDALSKAMAVGRLQADGLETVLANGGRVAEALAQALGTSVNGLRDMASQGKITSDVIAGALIDSLDKVRAEAAEMPATIGDAFTRIQTNITEFIGRMDQASGVSSAVAEGLLSFADGIRTTTSYMMAFGQVAAPAFDAVGAAISGIAGYADIALVAVAGFASPALIAGVWALSAALATGVAGGIKAITAAMMANPIGLLVGAIAAGVYAAYKFRDDIQEAIGVDVVDVFKTSANFVIGSFVGAYDNIKFVWNNFGDMMGAAVIGGVNIAIRAINGLIQKATEGVDGLVALINKIPGVDVGSIGKSFGINEIANPYANRLGASFSQLNERAAIAMNKDYIGALGERFKALRTAAQAEDEFRKATEAAGKATGGTTKSTGAATKAQQEFERERRSALVAQYQSISAIHAQAQGIEDQVALFGLSKSALEDLTIARLEEEAVVLRMYGDRSKDAVEAIEREIEARRRLRTAIGSLEQKEAERQQWQEWARDVEQIFNRVGQSLTDAIFDGGKSGKELLRDLFKGLTFNILINPVMNQMQGWVTNQLGGLFGVQQPGAGGGVLGMAQNLNTAYQAYSGGTASNLGQMIGKLGNQLGSETLRSFGMGLTGSAGAPGTVAGITNLGSGFGASLGQTIGQTIGTSAAAAFGTGALSIGSGLGASLGGSLATSMASTSFSAALGGGAAAAGGAAGAGAAAGGAAAGAGGAAGAGAALGAALPVIGVGLAAASLLGGGLFDREPTTRREQRNQIEYAGGAFDITRTDDRQADGAAQAARQMAEQAVATANDIFRQVGVDAAIDSFHAIMASSYAGDRDGVASGGMLRIGDELRQIGISAEGNPTIQGVGGWSSAEMLPRLATDISLTMLEAFQQADVLSSILEGVDIRGLGEEAATQLATTVQAIVQDTAAFQAAIEHLPFANLRDLSFDAAAAFMQLTGGMEGFMTAQASYTQNFYSEAERAQMTWDALGRTLGEVGLAVPQTRAEFRALVDAQDATSDAGRRSIAVLMGVESAFASVTQSADELAAAATRAAQEAGRAAAQSVSSSWSSFGTASGWAAQHLGDASGLQAQLDLMRQSHAGAKSVSAREAALGQIIALEQSIFQIEQQRRQAEIQAAQQQGQALREQLTSVNALLSASQRLRDYAEGLQFGADSGLSDFERLDVLGAQYASLLGKAQGGDTDAMGQLQGASRDYLGLAQQLTGSQADYSVLSGRIAAELAATATIQEASAKSQVDILQAQIASTEAISQALSEQFQVSAETKELIAQQLADSASQFDDQMKRVQRQIEQGDVSIALLDGMPLELTGVMQAVLVPPIASIADAAMSAASMSAASAEAARQAAASASAAASAAAAAAAKNSKAGAKSYDVGTSFVPYDMNANVHRGEIIIDPRSSDILRRYGIGVQGGARGSDSPALQKKVEQLEVQMARVAVATEKLADQFDNLTMGGNEMLVRDVKTLEEEPA